MWINKRFGYLQDWITQVWVKATGRRIDPDAEGWLIGPAGDTDLIGDKFIAALAEKEGLDILINAKGSGLLPSFDALSLNTEEKQRLDPRIIDFYEHTSNYHFDVWSSWCGIFRPFGWLLSVMFSRRLQQLNLPLKPMDSAQGIKSDIISLKDKTTGSTRWTIWFRVLKGTSRVIYSGVYSTCGIPGKDEKFLKVVFPLPNGNATVIMRREIMKDGSLRLSSDGRRFGDNGFYFTLTDHKGNYRARFVRSMHEWITVFTDTEGVLRADHELYFHGFPFLKLHYKMARRKGGPVTS